MWIFSLLIMSLIIVVGVILGLTPKFSRQSTPFGISVANKHKVIEEFKQQYFKANTGMGILLALPMIIFSFIKPYEKAERFAAMYSFIAIVVQITVSFGLYLYFRKQLFNWLETNPVLNNDDSKTIATDIKYHDQVEFKSHISFIISQIVIIVIPVIIAFVFYDSIPEDIPINWNANFEVGETVAKSIWSVLALPGIQLLLVPIMNLSNYAIVKSKQHISPLDPEKASEKSRFFRKKWSNMLYWVTIATQLLMSGVFLYSLFGNNKHFWILVIILVIFLFLTIGGPLYLSIKYGQAGEKLLAADAQYYSDPEEDESWKFGIFYYNKNDPSIFVEKRFGIGSTLNYGTWQAWGINICIIIISILLIVWAYLLK